MFTSHLTTLSRWTLPRLLAAAALVLTAALPAHATFVQGDWDPPFGPPFPDLGWRGTTTIFVPTACLVLTGTVVNDGALCPLMSVVNAKVEFYDLADTGLTTVEALNFDTLVAVERIVVNAGLVEGFALDSLGWVLSTSALGVTVPGGDQASFGLEIDILTDGTFAVLMWREDIGNPTGGRNGPPARLVITQFADPTGVSAPGSDTLALVGLVGLLATSARRRRR